MDNARDHCQARMNMRFDIRDFGSISYASIQLKPLTIFKGPANSGKSYAAKIIHSLVNAQCSNTNRAWYPFYDPTTILEKKSIEDISTEIQKTMDSKGKTRLSRAPFGNIVHGHLKKLARAALKGVGSNFDTSVDRLIRTGANSFEIKAVTQNGFEAIIRDDKKTIDAKLPHQRPSPGIISARTVPSSVSHDSDPFTYVLGSSSRGHHLYDVIRPIYRDLAAHVESGLPRRSYYFPAGMSGILHSYNTLGVCMTYGPSHATDCNDVMSITFRTACNLIRSIIQTPSDVIEPFADMAENMSETILNGKIRMNSSPASDLSDDLGQEFPSIEYITDDRTTPLHMASSAVLELAPLILYLRHVAVEGDLVILEEPESCLDQDGHMLMARYIVWMIRRGLNVLITTRSFLVISSLAVALESGGFDEATRKKLGFVTWQYILHEEVSTCQFVSARGSDAGEKFSSADNISLVDFEEALAYFHAAETKMKRIMQQQDGYGP